MFSGLKVFVATADGRTLGPLGAMSQQIRMPGGMSATTPAAPPVSTSSPGQPVHGQPPLSLTLMLVFTGCSVGLVIGVLLVGAILSIGRRPES